MRPLKSDNNGCEWECGGGNHESGQLDTCRHNTEDRTSRSLKQVKEGMEIHSEIDMIIAIL